MRAWRRAAAFAAATMTLAAGDLPAHGIDVWVERAGDVWVATARYDGGVPVAGADVVIHGPGAGSAYQVGRTDPAGRFAFVPAAPGEWRVRVDDGMGHRRTARAMVDVGTAAEPPLADAGLAAAPVGSAHPGEAGAQPEAPRQPALGGGETGLWRLATGLSLLFGLTGFAYGYTARSGSGAG
jgi:hypothetical protein